MRPSSGLRGRARVLVVALALLLAAPAPVGAQTPLLDWTRVFLPLHGGAMSLDGSPAAVYVKRGVGADAANFVLFFEGGGWAESLDDALVRSATALGSTNHGGYPNASRVFADRDLLLPNCTVNPIFCRYTTVYANYLDGASRASALATPIVVKGTPLFFRGFDVLKSTLALLLDPAGPGAGAPSLANATELVVSGSSAGGLTTYLHLDYIADTVHAVNPLARISGVPEVGFFLDAASIWSGQHLFTQVYTRVADFNGITAGSPTQVNAACVKALSDPSLRWRCFMAQYTYPHIRTRTFMLQSSVDEWQTENILAPNSNVSAVVSTYAPFKSCILRPGPPGAGSGCNATQWAQWSGYADQFYSALNESRRLTPPAVLALSGGFVTSCPIHTTAIGGLSHRIRIGGVTMYEALSSWFLSKDAPREGGWFTHDVAFPGNPSCPAPSPLGAQVR